jgi:hypothetical protein
MRIGRTRRKKLYKKTVNVNRNIFRILSRLSFLYEIRLLNRTNTHRDKEENCGIK